MKEFLKRHLSQTSLIRWVLIGLRGHPFTFVISIIRSLWATKVITGNFIPVLLRVSPGQKIKINKSKSSKVMINGIVSVNSWGGNSLPSSISLGEDAELNVSGDFEIGPNVHIFVSPNAKLSIGGRKNSTGSGITCDTRIMVRESITIGDDCIIAWDVFITDSNWHEIKSSKSNESVVVGDHVWISHGVSVLKGSNIPSGCIVGAKSIVSGKFDLPNALITGVPSKIVKENVEWKR